MLKMSLQELYERQAELQEQRQYVVDQLHEIAEEIHILEAKDWLERNGLTDAAILAIQGIANGSKVGTPGD